MTIAGSTFLSDSTLLVRNLLISGLTDPLSGTRSSESKLVLTALPTRTVEYPHIVIKAEDISTRRLGVGSEKQYANCTFQVRVWARTQTEKDRLTQEVIEALRTRQVTSDATGTIENSLFGFRLKSASDVDENTTQGPKSKILRFNYDVILE